MTRQKKEIKNARLEFDMATDEQLIGIWVYGTELTKIEYLAYKEVVEERGIDLSKIYE